MMMRNQELLEEEGFEDWEVSDDGAVWTCPHGQNIEPDGECDAGCRSPLLNLGWI